MAGVETTVPRLASARNRIARNPIAWCAHSGPNRAPPKRNRGLLPETRCGIWSGGLRWCVELPEPRAILGQQQVQDLWVELGAALAHQDGKGRLMGACCVIDA